MKLYRVTAQYNYKLKEYEDDTFEVFVVASDETECHKYC